MPCRSTSSYFLSLPNTLFYTLKPIIEGADFWCVSKFMLYVIFPPLYRHRKGWRQLRVICDLSNIRSCFPLHTRLFPDFTLADQRLFHAFFFHFFYSPQCLKRRKEILEIERKGGRGGRVSLALHFFMIYELPKHQKYRNFCDNAKIAKLFMQNKCWRPQ